mmetsp:Transcript_64887/g.145832  ORF Transcript_64887/g.145832 Transcript_64887/m.145832 type:complete len:371 (-) Transcript_64887:360-1472(-)
MAPKTNKRASKASAAPPAKKAKQADPNLVGVLDGLKQAEDLPASCRAMLEAAMPAALATAPADRHQLQATVVAWVEKVFAGVETKLKEAVAAAATEASSAEETQAQLTEKVSVAKAQAEAKAATVAEQESALSAAVGVVKDAKGKVAAAQKAQKASDAELAHASDDKQKLEAVVAEHLTYLKTEEGFDSKQATAHMKQLKPIAKQLKLDDSLLTALPSAAAQVPSKRGEFDRMVMGQLEAGIQGRVDELDGLIKNGETIGAERAGAVATAQRELEEAEGAENRAKEAVAAAKAEQKAAVDAVSAAEADLASGLEKNSAVLSAKEAKAFSLGNFKDYNLACFHILRDQVEEKAEAEPEGEVPAGKEEPAEA